jgi:phospholipase C
MEQDSSLIYDGLGNIKRVVVLMFENRSFDHLFGDFPNVNGLFDTTGNFKQDCYNLQDPLSPASGSNPAYFPTQVDPSQPLAHDFTHDFGDGMMPDLFGPVFTVTGTPPLPGNADAIYTSGYVKGAPTGQIQPTPATYPATNSGFFTTYNSCKQQEESVLTYFKNGDLQILHALAEEFVLCDNWHCDMPGHTLPNRAFIHCATTGDVGIDDTDGGMVEENSIFDLINQQSNLQDPPTWKMYAPVDNAGNLGQADTRFLNDNLQYYTPFSLTDFADDCNNGTLPFYSFIMCWLPNGDSDSYTDTSMHPASMIQPGENLLAGVYNTLRSSTCWSDTLLAVTFDENGGIYDHVFPPATTPPNPAAAPATQFTKGCCGNDWVLNSAFDFSLLGFRVPALLISPWLAKGIDNTQYQNTSVLHFLVNKLNAIYNINASPLTERDANAPGLASAFKQFGQSSMRTDCPAEIVPYSTLPCIDPSTNSNEIPYSAGISTPWTPPAGMDTAPPVPYINELINIYSGPLPGHADSGKPVTRIFATNAEVMDYTNERAAAADAYEAAKKL